MSFAKKLKKTPWWVILIILTIPVFFSLLRPGFFWMQDDLQAFRIHQLDKCIQDLQFPCRWVPDAGYQYGYPQFNYYPPSVYYLGEIIHLLGFQFIDAVKALFILGFILSALTMFVFLRSLFGNWPAMVGALLYTYAPYKAVEVYVRGALSEFWSFVFFPLIFWSIYQLIQTKRKQYLIWMAISIGLQLITHSLMSMIFLPIAGIWALVWIILEKQWKILPKVVLGGLLGVGLAAFFILPMSAEKKYSHSESMLGGYFDYRQHFVDLNQLFVSNHWGYGSSYLGPGDNLSLSAGHIHWLGALLALILALILFRKQKKLAIVSLVFSGVDLLVLFLTHQKSSFIWDKIPLFVWLQFPWRFLTVNLFLLSLLSAGALFLIQKNVSLGKYNQLPGILGVVMVVTAIFLYGGFFKPYRWYDISDKEKFSGELWQKELTISIFDYLPIYALLPPITQAPAFPEVLDGQVEFLNYRKGSNFQVGEVKVTEGAKIRLPLFDFPGMEVRVNGQKIEHSHNDCRGEEFCLGLISFDLPIGEHQIEARLKDTPVRKVSNIITLGSILILGVLLWMGRKR